MLMEDDNYDMEGFWFWKTGPGTHANTEKSRVMLQPPNSLSTYETIHAVRSVGKGGNQDEI